MLYDADIGSNSSDLPTADNSGGDSVALSDRLQQQQLHPCESCGQHVHVELDHWQYGGRYHHCCYSVC